MRLLLAFAATAAPAGRPSDLDLADLDAPPIGAFLDHLENDRGNTARTRNARLAAIHSPLPLRRPTPPRTPRRDPSARSRDPAKTHRNARSSASSTSTRSMRYSPPPTAPPGPAGATTRYSRSRSQTGLRASELTALARQDVHLGTGAARQLPRQRPQRPDHPAHRPRPSRSYGLARRARRPTPPARSSPPARWPLSPRRPRTPPSPNTRPPQPPALPLRESKRVTPARPAPHRRHAAPRAASTPSVIALWLGTRRPRDHPDLPSCRPRPLKEQALARTTPPHQPRPLPTPRHAHRLPRHPLIMPTSQPRSPPADPNSRSHRSA